MNYRELHKELEKWESEGIISKEQREFLDSKYKPEEKLSRFYTKLPAKKLLFIFTGIIVVLGTLAWLGQGMSVINAIVTFISLVLLGLGFICAGDYLAGRSLKTLLYSGKGLMILGCLFITFVVFYLDVKIKKEFGISILGNDWSLFMMVSGIILTAIAYLTKGRTILAYSLVMFVLWFICEGKIRTGGYTLSWFGLLLPIRLLILSAIFLGLGYIHNNWIEKLKKFNPSDKYGIFYPIYYTFGLLLAFVPIFAASLGRWLYIPSKIEIMVFVILMLGMSLYAIYIGLINDSKMFFGFGLTFFMLEVFGKVYGAFYNRIANPILYIIMFVVAIGILVAVEYILMHREQLREELLKEIKG